MVSEVEGSLPASLWNFLSDAMILLRPRFTLVQTAGCEHHDMKRLARKHSKKSPTDALMIPSLVLPSGVTQVTTCGWPFDIGRSDTARGRLRLRKPSADTVTLCAPLTSSSLQRRHPRRRRLDLQDQRRQRQGPPDRQGRPRGYDHGPRDSGMPRSGEQFQQGRNW